MVDFNKLTVSDDVEPGRVNGTPEADNARAAMSAEFQQEQPKERPKAPEQPKQRPGKIATALSKMYGNIGVMLYPFDPHCSEALLNNADNMAKSLEDLAKENEAVRRVLMRLTETSAWTQVITAHAPLLMAVGMHHGGAVTKLVRKDQDQTPQSSGHPPSPPADTESDDVPGETAPVRFEYPGDNAA